VQFIAAFLYRENKMESINNKNLSQESKSNLICRNVTVQGRRTSMRLEIEMWRALKDVASREKCAVSDICSLIKLRKHNNTSLTAAVRTFLLLYYRAASTEEGHRKAQHGNFENMRIRANKSLTINQSYAKPEHAVGP
jgi:predicted DNA-binding ribbon-helix-helix protein